MMRPEIFKFRSFIFFATLSMFNSVVFALVTTDLEKMIENAPMLNVEKLLVPVSTVSKGPQMLVPNRGGKTYDLLQWYYRSYSGPTTVFIIDLESGDIKKDQIPLGRQIYLSGNVIGPDGKLYIATPDREKGMELYVYDPVSNDLANKGVIVAGLGGEKRQLVVGTDGMIYGTGSYRIEKKAGAYQLNPWTLEVVDYGPIGPSHAPNPCWGDTIAADDRYVYVVSGMLPWHLVAYDKSTKQEQVLLSVRGVGGHISVKQERYGCSVIAKGLDGTAGGTVEYWLYQGTLLKKSPRQSPPWFEPRIKKPWVDMRLMPRVFSESGEPGPDGAAQIWYQKKALGNNSDTNWKTITLKLPTYPVNISRVLEMPNGNFFGAAENYQGYFIYDTKLNKSIYLGRVPLSTYAMVMSHGKIYMSGYPKSELYVYDPSRRWTVGQMTPFSNKIHETGALSNPRHLARLKESGASKMYSAAIGGDGRIYFGGRWYRNGNGGGLAWWDIEGAKTGGFWEEFSNYQIDYMTTVADGRYVVISTVAVADSLLNKPKPKQGKLFVFDISKREIIREIEPVFGAVGSGLIAGFGDRFILGMTDDPDNNKRSILYKCNIQSGEIVKKIIVSYPMGVKFGSNQMEPFDYRLGPDQKIWTFIEKVLVKIDPGDMAIDVVGKVDLGGKIAFAGNDLYLASTAHLRRIRNIVWDDLSSRTAFDKVSH